jgi:hypothetical protein
VKRTKREVILPWLLCLLCLGGASTNLVRWLVALRGRPTLFELVEALGWGWALPVTFAALAALIIARRPRHRVGWLLMLPALVKAIPTVSLLATPQARLTPGLWLLLWFDNWSWIPVIFPIFLIPLHFPTGHPPTPRWSWVNRLAMAMWLFFILVLPFTGPTIGPPNHDWTLPNPLALISYEAIEGPFMILWGIGLATVLVASVTSLFLRYRAAQRVERQQIKWLLYAGTVFVIVYTSLFYFSDRAWGSGSPWGGLLDLVLVLAILAIGVAIAIAILRHRLYDIDLIIRKTLVYGLMTGALALLYFGSVLSLQNLFGRLAGERSPLIIVLSTLLLAAIFRPLRKRVQTAIDRRFYRNRYDAQQVLAQFAAAARDQVSFETLSAELLRVVQETMQPERVTLWVRQGGHSGR